MSQVLNYLHLPQAEIKIARQNERSELRLPGLNRRIIALRKSVERARTMLGFDVAPSRNSRRGTCLMKMMNRVNSRAPDLKSGLSSSLRGELAEVFRPEVKTVETASNRKVPSWAEWPSSERPSP